MQTNRAYRLILLLALSTTATLASADMKPAEISAARQLFNNNGCASCHEISGKSAGPALRDIAKRYKGKKVEAELATRIREGSIGRWGNDEAHPPMGVLEPEEAKLLANWVLSGAP